MQIDIQKMDQKRKTNPKTEARRTPFSTKLFELVITKINGSDQKICTRNIQNIPNRFFKMVKPRVIIFNKNIT